MTFVQLYSTFLDIELASSDTTQLFTTVRRKLAVNEAAKAFARMTDCLKRYGSVPIIDETGEYDLEVAFTDFIRVLEDPSVKIIGASDTRYIQGDDLPRRDPAQLDWENPNWRAADAGTPMAWYLRPDGGATFLGLTPAPDVGSGEMWTILVPYSALPADMSADIDLPFTVSSNSPIRIAPYHQALVHYAAASLEPLRKNYAGAQRQMSLYNDYIAKYYEDERTSGPDQITMMRGYFDESKRQTRAVDWRRFP
jgi:hypothetical protein